MDRRTMLRVGGMAALGLGAGACGSRRAGPRLAPRAPFRLPPVRVSFDRVIATSVGLRPFRRSGFRVEAERLGDKVMIHNYGHGGAGVALSWGTAAMAADLALETEHRRAAVIGAGAVGLATARTLQRRGFDVTIYAKAVNPDTTSTHALAGFTPASRVIETDRRTPEFDDRFVRATEIAYRAWQFLAGDHYGVKWLDVYSPAPSLDRPARAAEDEDDIGRGLDALLADRIPTERIVYERGQHPFPIDAPFRREVSMMFWMPIYLEAVMRDVLVWGGRIVIREFASRRDLATLPEPIVVTCVGLGARDLLEDAEMEPVKGQYTILVPQPEVDYRIWAGGRVSMWPRNDGILIGNSGQRGVWSTEPDEAIVQRTVEGAMDFFGRMAGGVPQTTRRERESRERVTL